MACVLAFIFLTCSPSVFLFYSLHDYLLLISAWLQILCLGFCICTFICLDCLPVLGLLPDYIPGLPVIPVWLVMNLPLWCFFIKDCRLFTLSLSLRASGSFVPKLLTSTSWDIQWRVASSWRKPIVYFCIVLKSWSNSALTSQCAVWTIFCCK